LEIAATVQRQTIAVNLGGLHMMRRMTMHDSDAVLDQLMSKAGLLVADTVAPVSAPVDRRHDHIALAVESAHLPGDAARGFASCRSNKKIFSSLSLIAFSDLDRSLVGSVRDHRFDQFWICVWANLYDPEVVFIGF
jgi:hypothetical protein